MPQSGISMYTRKKKFDFVRPWISFIDINVAEHEPSNTIAKDSDSQSWQTATERTLIR